MYMSKILIITCSYDKTIDYIIEKNKYRANFFRFNVDLFADYGITISNSYWEISYRNNTINSNTTLSIYYRKPTFPDTSDFAPEYRRIINSDILAIIDGLANSFSGVVLTKPYLLRQAENKIFQLIYAKSHSILMPKSFIGNNDYWKCINDQRIIKPISVGKIETSSGIAIIQTNLMHENDSYDSPELTPVYIQEYIKKSFEVRITVVDDDFFAVKIVSDNMIDWRAGNNNQYEIIDIPIEIKKCIKMMMKDFQLRFGAIDYIVDVDGKWYFLEINPNGQWQWLECILGLSISDSIMNMLLGG
jgi:glutathione synthase/RimK-type ligase-like ATP-grasp enzyme